MQKVMLEPKLTYQTKHIKMQKEEEEEEDISESTYDHLFTPPIPKLSFCFHFYFFKGTPIM